MRRALRISESLNSPLESSGLETYEFECIQCGAALVAVVEPWDDLFPVVGRWVVNDVSCGLLRREYPCNIVLPRADATVKFNVG